MDKSSSTVAWPQALGWTAEEVSSAADFPVPEPHLRGCLGDFRILREIGRGGMGVVYEAEQMSLGRRVALKVLPCAAAWDGRQLQRFRNEAHAAAHLQHQNIVPVYFVGCERGVHFYAMQLIEGRTLSALISELREGLAPGLPSPAALPLDDVARQRPLKSTGLDADRPEALDAETKDAPQNLRPSTEERGSSTTPRANGNGSTEPSARSSSFFRMSANLGMQAAEALEHAHGLGVVHRDIKPANLMVDLRGNLWITDFGLARLHGDSNLTMSGDLLGTLRYMSPEQTMGPRIVMDHRTDVYSLGVTLYELLTLEPALPGHDRQELLRRIAFEEPKPPRRINKSIPAELETIVLKAMEKNPADRYATAQELAEDLQRFLKDEQIRAKRPTLVQRARRWARRHQPIVWSALVATAVVSLLAVVILAVSNFRITRETAQRQQAFTDKDAALTAAKAAQKEVQENLSDARAAVDRMLTRVADRLGGVPQMEHVRRELLEDALKFYQKFLGKNGDDPVLRLEAAWAYRRLAAIQRHLGQLAEAEKSFRQAFAMLEELQAQSPFEPSTRSALASAHVQFARLLRELGKHEEPEEHLRLAVRMVEDLVREFPTDPGYGELLVSANVNLITLTRLPPDQTEEMLRRNLKLTKNTYLLGYIYSHLGLLGVRQGRYPEAKQDYLKSLEKFKTVASESPSSSMAQRDVGSVLVLLADALAADGQREEAEPLYRRAVAILDKPANDYPGIRDYRHQQAEAHYKYAMLLKALDRTADAEQTCRRAAVLYENLAADFPSFPAYQQTAFDQRLDLGRFLLEAGRLQDAQQVYGEAIGRAARGTGDFSSRLKHWQGLIRSHVELGGLMERAGKTKEAEEAFRQALAISESLEADHGGKPEYRRDLARSHMDAAWLLRLNSRYSEAAKHYHWALAHYLRLAGESSQAQQAREELAYAHMMQAQNYSLAPGGLADAEKAYQQALNQYEKLSADFPNVPRYGIAIASDRLGLAAVLQFQGRVQEAKQALNEALPLAERLAKEHPADATVRITLALGSRHWGETLRDTARTQEAEKAFRRSEAILEKLVADFPHQSWERVERGVTCQLLAALLARDLKQPQAAEEFYRRGVDIFEKLAAEFPREPSYRMRLADAHREWAFCLRDIGRAPEATPIVDLAIANFSKAIELGSKDIWGVWYPQALLYLSTGRTKEYRALCETLLERFSPSNDPFHVVVICRLAPDAVADLARAVEIAEKLPAREPHNADAAGILGDALYRKGDLDAAVQRLEASIRDPRGIGFHWRRLFLAMAYHRLGRAVEARQLLNETTQWMETNAQEKLAEGAQLGQPLPWCLRLDLQLLRHEVEGLLGIEKKDG